MEVQTEREFNVIISTRFDYNELTQWEAYEFDKWEASFEVSRYNVYLDTPEFFLKKNNYTLSLIYGSNLTTNNRNKLQLKTVKNDSHDRLEFSYEFNSKEDIQKHLLIFVDRLKRQGIYLPSDISLVPFILLKQKRCKRGIYISGKKVYISFDEVQYYLPTNRNAILASAYFCEFEADETNPFSYNEIEPIVNYICSNFNGKVGGLTKFDLGYKLKDFGIWNIKNIFSSDKEWLDTYRKLENVSDYNPYRETIDMLWQYAIIHHYNTLDDQIYKNMYFATQKLKSTLSSVQTKKGYATNYNNLTNSIYFSNFEDLNKKEKFSRFNYTIYLGDKDQEIRREAFNIIYEGYLDYEKQISELLITITQNSSSHYFEDVFQNQYERKNFISNIFNLVHDNIYYFKKYAELRRKIAHLDTFYLFDMQFNLLSNKNNMISLDESKKKILVALRCLNKNEFLKELMDNGHIDIHNRKNKKNGNYTLPCKYPSPYISISYDSTYSSVITLAHELGHAMGILESDDYMKVPVFIQEIQASIAEALVMRYLSNNIPQIEYLELYLEKYRSNFFRQMMLFEFEYKCSEKDDLDVNLIPNVFSNVLHEYYDKDVVHIPDNAKYEYLKTPHFYLYPQIIGIYPIAFAIGEFLADEILNKRFDFDLFLKSSSQGELLLLLEKCGCTLSLDEIMYSFFGKFKSLLEKYEVISK